VFVVDKAGKVLAAQAGSPEGTVNVVKEIVESLSGGGGDAEGKKEVQEAVKDAERAEVGEKTEEMEAQEKKEEEEGEGEGEGGAAPANGEGKAEEKADGDKKEE
jgi:peroxiredoxin Q/BCP